MTLLAHGLLSISGLTRTRSITCDYLDLRVLDAQGGFLQPFSNLWE